MTFSLFDVNKNYKEVILKKGEEFYFRVQIELDTKELITKNGRKIEISPGMTANIDIVTGERTVFDYLAKPIVKTMSESFQER